MSVLGRCNPTVKLVLLLAVSVVTLFTLDPGVLAALYALAVVGTLAAAGLGPRRLAVAHVPFVLFGVGLVAVNALSRPGTPLLDGPFRVTREGVVIGLALALRALVIGVLSTAFLATTPPRDLMVSLTQQAHLSPRYAYAVLAGHRMLDAMPRRWATIRAAQAVRAPLDRHGRPRLGITDAARAAFTLLVGSVRAAERTALALESRGLGSGPRTIWHPAPLGLRDAATATVVAVVVGLVLAASPR